MKLSWFYGILLILLIVIVGNFFVLDFYLISVLPKMKNSAILVPPSQIEQPTPVPTTQAVDLNTFKQEIYSALATLSAKTPVIQNTIVNKKSDALVKEIFIPLGTGNTTSDQWEDIAGTDAYIDTTKYPTIDTVYFEGSLKIPTKNGVVSARLYNVTDKHPVWYSEISTSNDTSTFLGTKITLDPGNKVYRIQMKTSLKYQSFIDSGRVKIQLK